MPGSPLKKNYVHQIKGPSTYLDQVISPTQTTGRFKKPKSSQIQTFDGCIREKIYPDINQNDYFEMVMYQNGIFNINKVHKSSIKLSQVKKNLSKQCIPIQQRYLKSLFLFPTQTIVQCQYNIENKFHKQMIFYCPGEYLIVNNFNNGKMDKEQYNFNLKGLILVKTIFNKDKITSVKDYSLADQVQYFGQDQPLHANLKIKLQKYFLDKDFCKMLYRLTQGFFDWLVPIEKGSSTSSYFGKLSTSQNLPDGIGLLVNRKPQPQKAKSISSKSSIKNESQVLGFEFFFGIFRSGLLDVIGQIWFRDKSSYYGEFDIGSIVGIGQYFSLKAGIKKNNKHPLQSFQFKDGMLSIARSQFFKFIKEGYFNGKKNLSSKDILQFMINQFQKLRKIYAIPKPKEELSPEFQEPKNVITSQMRNSQEIHDFGDQFCQPSFCKGKKTPKISDSKFHKKQDIKDIFEKIRVTDAKNQKNDSRMNKRIPQFDRTKTAPYDQNRNQITSRSDDHSYNFIEKRLQQKNLHNKQKQTLKKYENEENEYDQSFREVNGWSDERIQTNKMMDSGYDDVDSSYLRNKELSSTVKYHNEPDYIQKQYAFQNPRNFRAPDYFIVQNQRAHVKLDPNSFKADIVREGRTKKNEYSSPPRVKKQNYLSPNEKENQLSIKKYEHALNKNRSKRIFYNPPPK